MSMKAQPAKRLSCVSCRNRKIKCDRVDPCANCVRADLRCIYPLPAPPRPRAKPKTKSDQLAQRLSRLEGFISKLGGEDVIAARAQEGQPIHSLVTPTSGTRREFADVKIHSETSKQDNFLPSDGSSVPGKGFLTNLALEFEELRTFLLDSEDEDADDELAEAESINAQEEDERHYPSSHYLFGHNHAAIDLRRMCPGRNHANILFTQFFEQFDPFFKLLHRPSASEQISSVLDRTNRMPPGTGEEALAFAIFYAGLTTMSSHECISRLEQDQALLLRHLESCVEAALTNADLLTTTDQSTLQAFVIYIMCIHTHHKTRSSWTLISLAVRIAMAMDINIDGTILGLSEFETEMRRRLWWAIIVLDLQGCEDRGTKLLVHSFSYSTDTPSNINDNDLDPELGITQSDDEADDEEGFTEMTFSLIMCEVAKGYEYVSLADPQSSQDHYGYKAPSHEDKEHRVNEINNLIHSRWVQHCDMSIPLEAKALMISQINILKLWLLLQYPIVARRHSAPPKPTTTQDQILSSAVSLLEIQHRLELIDDMSWATRNWMEWHALAVTLAELCTKTSGPLVDRAWAILDIIFEPWSDAIGDKKADSMWRPVRKLMLKARRIHRRPTTSKAAGQMSWEDVPGGITDVTAMPNPSMTRLHDASIAMALNSPMYPHSHAGPSGPQAVPQGFQYYSGPATDGALESVNWKDWAPFLETAAGHGAHSGATSYRSVSLEPPR